MTDHNGISDISLETAILRVRSGRSYYDAREEAAIYALQNKCDVTLTCNDVNYYFFYKKLIATIEEEIV